MSPYFNMKNYLILFSDILGTLYFNRKRRLKISENIISLTTMLDIQYR
jgi:hypothetical protein